MPTALASANSSSAAPAATPLTSLQANWAYPNANQFNWNYNPQTVINSSNVQYLGLAWLFPLPTHPTALLSVSGGLGVDTALMIINGTVYAVTQFGQVFALNAANGDVIWTDVLPILPNSTLGMSAKTLNLHFHDGNVAFTTKLFGGTPTIWVSAPDEKVYAINALSGKYEMNFSHYNSLSSVAGNNPNSVYNGRAMNILVDQTRGIAITSMLSSSSNNAARCFYRGWNVLVNPPTLMWTAFCSPPQPGSGIPVNPNWDTQQIASMKGAWIFKGYGADNPGGYGGPSGAVDLKSLPAAQQNASLYNDWGYIQSAACSATDGGASPGATGAGWGASWISDQKTGIAYINTGNKGPYDSPCTPGPDLWSAAVMALNETTGQWVWGFQSSAHELWDYDCSWQQALGNETISGVNTEVLWKTCKSGYLYELNAATGALIWSWTPPTSILGRCHYCYPYDPLNSTQMSYAFFNPNPGFPDSLMYPSEFAASENSFSYNPALNYIIMVTHNVPLLTHYVPFNSTNYGNGNGETFYNSASGAGLGGGADNSTVEAVNGATGQMAWSYFMPIQGFRGGVTTSGNVVYLAMSSGDLIMLNAQTGKQIRDLYIGGPLNVLPSIGATASGQMQIVMPITAGSVSWANGVPGDLVALNLQNVPAATTNTVTSTATSTTTVGGGSTVTTTTTVGGGATVTKTTTVGGAGSTVTVSGAGSITTSISTVTASSGGVSSTTLYGVGAVAAIFIIATGYLAMRGRKPAS
ncbi:MAG: PQQ-binding-like beta-propeller repeat protein [Thaumarchaeota archaeon]|nr:PQQ-binding-like beta-propeller repeat protein [Nitrososphaerota archaeon]